MENLQILIDNGYQVLIDKQGSKFLVVARTKRVFFSAYEKSIDKAVIEIIKKVTGR